MTDKRIIWEMPDGAIQVTIPAPKGRRSGEGETDWFDRVAAKAKPDGAIRLVDHDISELPTRTRRHAWRKNPATGKIFIDSSVPDLPGPVTGIDNLIYDNSLDHILSNSLDSIYGN